MPKKTKMTMAARWLEVNERRKELEREANELKKEQEEIKKDLLEAIGKVEQKDGAKQVDEINKVLRIEQACAWTEPKPHFRNTFQVVHVEN